MPAEPVKRGAGSLPWKLASDIVERLRDLRKALGLEHQKSLAPLFRVTEQQVSVWMQGRQKPRRSMLAAWAAERGVPLAIFEEGGPMPSTVLGAHAGHRTMVAERPGDPYTVLQSLVARPDLMDPVVIRQLETSSPQRAQLIQEIVGMFGASAERRIWKYLREQELDRPDRFQRAIRVLETMAKRFHALGADVSDITVALIRLRELAEAENETRNEEGNDADGPEAT